MSETNDGLDMTGIDARFTVNVPEGAQARIAAVDKDLRFVWNDRCKKFQVVYREPGLVTQFDEGSYLQGWGLVGTFDAPLLVDVVCREMGHRKNFEEMELKRLGFKNIEEYLDAVTNKVLIDEDDPAAGTCDPKTKELIDKQVDDFCGIFAPEVTKIGAYGEFGNSEKFTARRREKALDQTSRAHSGKFRPVLTLPKRPTLFVPPEFTKKDVTP